MKTNNHDILATSDYVQNKPLLLSSFHAPSSIDNTENATKTYRWVLEQFMAYNITDGMVLSLDDEGGSVNDTRIFPVFDSARGWGPERGGGDGENGRPTAIKVMKRTLPVPLGQ